MSVSNKSKSIINHNFSSKNKKLIENHDVFITYALKKTREADKLNKTPTKRLIKILDEFVHVFDLYQAHLSVFYQEAFNLDDEYEKIIKEKRNAFKSIISSVLYDGIKAGEFRQDLNIDLTTMAILGMVNWMYKWYNPNGKNTISEISNFYIDFIMHSVLVDVKTL